MRKYFISLLLVFTVTYLFAQTIRVYKTDRIEEREGKQYYVHTVLQGQTVYSISKAYEVSTDEIYFENPDTKDGISIDQDLWIPTINKETELNREIKTTDFEFFYHIAKTNQNYRQLSDIYHIPENTIRQANAGLFAPFREGSYIKIPVEESLPSSSDSQDVSFDPNLQVIPDFRHTVSLGETIYSISKKYNVTVNSLRAVNPGLTGTLEPGDRLRIPKEQSYTDNVKEDIVEEKPQEPINFKHRVRRKETLYSISRQYGVTLQEIYAENPGLTSSINEGQIINVPTTSLDKPFVIYTVDKRTRLKKVAKLYNIPIYRIQDENPSIGTKVYPGQRIRIPVGKMALDQLEKEEVDAELKEEVAKEAEPTPVRCRKIRPHYNKVFNVALMIPLYLEEMDSLDMEKFLDEKQNGFYPFRYIEFYEGALMAVDSLRKEGMNLKLFVFDVDQSITKTTKVLQSPEIRNMDLIVGPFHSKSFDQVALFAGNFNIPVVNPLSYRDKVANKYPTAIKVKSDRRKLVELVPRLIPEYYQDDKVFLISHTSYKDADIVTDLANNLKTTIKPQQKLSNNDLYNLTVAVAHRDTTYTTDQPLPSIKVEGLDIYPDTIESQIFDSTIVNNDLIRINYMKDSIHPFLDNASPLRNNLVILYGDSKAFMMDAMNRLNEHRDTFNIRLVGLPQIERFNNLDNTQANNMNLTYFSTNYIDYNSDQTERFIKQFREEYKTEPGIYGFNGFDVTYYFLNALFNLDDRLTKCLEHVPLDLMLTRYKFGKAEGAANYQNTYWNLIRYEGLTKRKLPDPVNQENE